MNKRIKDMIIDVISSGPAMQGDIVRALGISRSRASEVISELEREGVVRRQRIGRGYRVSYVAGGKVSDKVRLGIIRASEYGYVAELYRRARWAGHELQVEVYESATDVLRDLVSGRIDFAIAPVITQLFFLALGFPIRAIAPGGAGGSAVMGKCNPSSIASSVASTMEMLVRAGIREAALPRARLVYFSTPEWAVKSVGNAVDAVSIWEPYASVLRSRGVKELLTYEELGEHVCCALAGLPGSENHWLVKEFPKAVSAFSKERRRYAQPYSAIVGLPSALIEESFKMYEYPEELNARDIARQLHTAGVLVPDADALLERLIGL